MAMVAGLDILPSYWTMDWSLPTQRDLEWVQQSSRTLQTLPVGTTYKKDKARADERGRIRGNSDASNKDVMMMMTMTTTMMMVMEMMTMTTTMMMMMMMMMIMISSTAAASYFKM